MKKLVLALMAATMMTGMANAGNLYVKSTAGFVGEVTANEWHRHIFADGQGEPQHMGTVDPGAPVSYRVSDILYGWNHATMPTNGNDLVIEFYNSWFNPGARAYEQAPQ